MHSYTDIVSAPSPLLLYIMMTKNIANAEQSKG